MTSIPRKLCECGCGKPTKMAKFNIKSRGVIKGQPLRFIHNHPHPTWIHTPKKPMADRFWPKVDKRGPDDCWIWRGGKNKKGYGTFGRGGMGAETNCAHRFAWELANGPIPEGMHILHKCDNPSCCNPNHLFPGTPAQNTADMISKGRISVGSHRSQAMHKGNPERFKVVLLEKDVIRIRKLHDSGKTYAEIARMYGMCGENISHICRRHTWKHVP